MAKCNKCGAEGLTWETVNPTRGFILAEPEGGLHVCSEKDKAKELQRKLNEKEENVKLTQEYKHRYGYL